MSASPLVIIDCQTCHKEYGRFKKKDVPKSFVCPFCKTGQTYSAPSGVGFTKKRNYPEGYYLGKLRY